MLLNSKVNYDKGDMKKTIGLFVVLLILFGIYSFKVKERVQKESSVVFSKGDRFESFTLSDINGQSVVLDSVIADNKYVWVNFWASWCGPCRREMPMMAEVYEKFKDRGFSIVAVNVGEDVETVKSYLSGNPVPFTILLDPQSRISSKFNIESLPTSFLIDSAGVIQERGVGIQSSWDYLIAKELEVR